MNIQDQLNQEMRNTRNNDFYRFQEGDNRIRILSEGAPIAKHFIDNKPSVCYGITKGCPFHGDKAPKDDKGNPKQAGIKYTCYILDRIDNQIKLTDIPYSVIKKIGEFQIDNEWSFDSFPMPYDIKVVYKPKESPANMYSVIQSPKREPLSDEIMSKLAELLVDAHPLQLVQNQKDRAIITHKDQGIWLENKSSLTNEEKERIASLKTVQKSEEISPDDIPF